MTKFRLTFFISFILSLISFYPSLFCTLPNIVYAELTEEQRIEYLEQEKLHEQKAVDAFNHALSALSFLPETKEKKIAKWCFVSCLCDSYDGTPKSMVVANILSLFVSYGLNEIQDFQIIQAFLKEAEYHFEMMEFYETVLVLG